MKICLFSDIHGNGLAFRAAYPMILSEGADINLFLGDLCGYYFDQEEILDGLLTLPNFEAVRGNHDQMFLDILYGDEVLRQNYLKKFGRSMENLLERNSKAVNQWLSGLSDHLIHPMESVTATHGSPWDHLEGYVYPDSPLEKFSDFPETLFFLGHTHHRMVLAVGEKKIVNPGSLGQPRGGGWPSYAVMDYRSGEVFFREVPYDRTALLRQIEELDGHHPYLKKHLVLNN
jgi:putative phosphoesterase